MTAIGCQNRGSDSPEHACIIVIAITIVIDIDINVSVLLCRSHLVIIIPSSSSSSSSAITRSVLDWVGMDVNDRNDVCLEWVGSN